MAQRRLKGCVVGQPCFWSLQLSESGSSSKSAITDRTCGMIARTTIVNVRSITCSVKLKGKGRAANAACTNATFCASIAIILATRFAAAFANIIAPRTAPSFVSCFPVRVARRKKGCAIARSVCFIAVLTPFRTSSMAPFALER